MYKFFVMLFVTYNTKRNTAISFKYFTVLQQIKLYSTTEINV